MTELPEDIEREVYAVLLGAPEAEIDAGLSALAARHPHNAGAIAGLAASLRTEAIRSPTGEDLLRRLRGIWSRARHERRYAHIQELGAGGQGAVSVVRDHLLGRKIAFKTIHAKHGVRLGRLDPAVVHRFLDEAQIAAQLCHPAIPLVHDLGVSSLGVPFFTMRFVQGQTLDHVVERHQGGDPVWPRRHVVRVLVEVAKAIEYAHQQDVLHLDLKPANVVIGRFGEVCVIDWGFARAHRAVSQLAAEHPVAIDRTSPQDCLGKGSPGFTAPEQWRGSFHVGCDVFSLGAILYQLLVGMCLPVDWNESRRVLPVEVWRSDRTLSAICVRASAPRPEARYPTMAALRSDLCAYLEDRPVTVLPSGLLNRVLMRARRLTAAWWDRTTRAAAPAPAHTAPTRTQAPQHEQPMLTLALLDPTAARPALHQEVGTRNQGLAGRLADIAALGASPERFRDSSLIAQAGMADVDQVHDSWLHRQVAVKTVRAWLGDGERVRGILLDEAQVMAQLDHPSVLTAHDLLVDSRGRLGIVMPRAIGGSLRDLQLNAQTDWRETVPLLLQASRGLAFAHEKGVVHRDVKPANILLGQHGDAYMADWGLCMVSGKGIGDSDIRLQRGASFIGHPTMVSNTMENSGCIVGTPYYMAPEQWQGSLDVGPYTDVYGLGVVLFELLTDSMPFEFAPASSIMEMMQRVCADNPPPVRTRNPQVPKYLAEVCDLALRRNPAERYRNAGAFALALDEALDKS